MHGPKPPPGMAEALVKILATDSETKEKLMHVLRAVNEDCSHAYQYRTAQVKTSPATGQKLRYNHLLVFKDGTTLYLWLDRPVPGAKYFEDAMEKDRR